MNDKEKASIINVVVPSWKHEANDISTVHRAFKLVSQYDGNPEAIDLIAETLLQVLEALRKD